MTGTKQGTFFSGAAMVWRRQRILWLIYVVNFVLVSFGTYEAKERVAKILNHRLAAAKIVKGFDLGAVVELGTHPELPFQSLHSGLFHSSLLFLVFMIFATGGILATYYSGERLHAGAFFEACGHHFWRFFRLILYLVPASIPIGILGAIASRMYDRIDTKAISPMPAVHLLEAAIVILLFVLICVRVWFDMAQVIAVAEDERRMRTALRRAAGLFRHNFGSLFWLYVRVSLLAWIVFAAGMHIWMYHLRPDSFLAPFLLSEFIIVFWLASRLWQRASESIWYRNYQRAIASSPAYEPPPVTAPPVVPPETLNAPEA
jgi:hypothetical protein